MTIQTLIDRFRKQPNNPWELSDELSNLLGEELEDNLTDEEKSTLSDFRTVFLWDTKYRINCEYIIPTSSLWGHYEVDDLKEYLSIEEGQDTSLSYDDIHISDEDIYGGEVQVEGKEVVVRNLRVKPEVVALLGLKKD
jgi:hypothetical protein